VLPFIGETDQGMTGGSTPQDLETMFQLLYLRFTQPREDPTAFAAVMAQAKGLLANREASPDVAFNQALDEALSGNSPRRAPETAATVAQWSLAKSFAFYKARFADASRFKFFFVGSFTPDMLRPYVETYLASLPATRGGETWRDLGIRPPAGIINQRIEKGIAPKSQIGIVFSGPFVYDDAHLLAIQAMNMVLQSRRHLQHRDRAADLQGAAAGVHAADRVGVRSGAGREPGATGLRRDSLHQGHTAHARPDGAAARRDAARFRARQPGQRLPAQPDRKALRIRRRRGPVGGGGPARPDHGVDERGGGGGGADLSRYRALREGHADAGNAVTARTVCGPPHGRGSASPAVQASAFR
jgi:hypothetical protein